MKEGWEYKKLPEISENLDSLRKPVTKKNRTAGIYPYYGASGIVDYVDDYLFDEDLLCISEDGANLLMRTYPIAFPISGKVWVNNHAHVLRFKNVATQKYVEYFFAGLKLDKYITGAAQPKLTQKALNNIIINIPTSIDEQQSIVDYLDSAFAKIDAMKANAEKALGEAKALFQASLKEMLEPKEGWEEKKLKDIVDTKCPISYGIVQQGDHVDGGVPVVRPVDLYRKYITSSNLKCTTPSISDSYKRTILRGDEILLGVRGTTGLVGIATEELKGSNVNRGIVPLFFKDCIYRDFIYYEMLSPAMQSVFAEKTTGATLKQINIKDLRTISFSYPVFEVQQQIVTTLDSLKSKVDRLQENYDKISQECDALKQAILRQVFE